MKEIMLPMYVGIENTGQIIGSKALKKQRVKVASGIGLD